MRHPGFFAMLWSPEEMDRLDTPLHARRRGGRRGTRGEPPPPPPVLREKAMKRARRQGVTLWTA
jgi:hypothetical protein